MSYVGRRLLWMVVAALVGCVVRWAFWRSVNEGSQVKHPPRHAYQRGE